MAHPDTRHSLIIRLRNEQDEPAWRDFVTAYEPFLMRLVARQGVPEHHVPDVTQQILIAIGRSVGNWKPDNRPESFRRWLKTPLRQPQVVFLLARVQLRYQNQRRNECCYQCRSRSH